MLCGDWFDLNDKIGNVIWYDIWLLSNLKIFNDVSLVLMLIGQLVESFLN